MLVSIVTLLQCQLFWFLLLTLLHFELCWYCDLDSYTISASGFDINSVTHSCADYKIDRFTQSVVVVLIYTVLHINLCWFYIKMFSLLVVLILTHLHTLFSVFVIYTYTVRCAGFDIYIVTNSVFLVLILTVLHIHLCWFYIDRVTHLVVLFIYKVLHSPLCWF